jgi:hypothetical protein
MSSCEAGVAVGIVGALQLESTDASNQRSQAQKFASRDSSCSSEATKIAVNPVSSTWPDMLAVTIRIDFRSLLHFDSLGDDQNASEESVGQ